MANVLLAWELGGGIGHLTVLRPIAEHFIQAGHQVHLVSRDLAGAETVFGDLGVGFYQAPIKFDKPIAPIEEPMSYSQLLHNCGFETEREIAGRLKAWDRLFDVVNPRLVVCDHCPSTLLAARGRDIRVALVGTGFVNPPVGELMPSLMPWKNISPNTFREIETETLSVTNAALKAVGKPEMERMSDLYGRADCTLITSFKELDHFGERQDFRYSGAWPPVGGDRPQWPNADGVGDDEKPKRVFAYLKRSPGLTDLLTQLGKCGHSVLVYGNWTTLENRQKFDTPTMRVLEHPVDMQATAEQCDVAILNGTHGATAAMLLGGAPILQLPIYLEQRLVAGRVARIGAGLVADRRSVQQVMSCLDKILTEESFAASAQRFAATYRQVDPARQSAAMLGRLDALLSGECDA